jgi:hypothetical protein
VRSSVLVSPALATALGVGLFCMLLLIGCGGGLQESPTEKAEEEAGVEEATDEGGAATAASSNRRTTPVPVESQPSRRLRAG